MLGAIAGDIIGSIYERKNIKTKDFPLFDRQCSFTDDTVLTVAVAEVILDGRELLHGQYIEQFKSYFRRYPFAGYGGTFRNWANSNNSEPYNSWGNGSAMRVSPIGFAFNDLDTVIKEAKLSAEITHNHPEGIKGAQATAAAIFLARTGNEKSAIKSYIQTTFGYDLEPTLDEIRPNYKFDVSCQGSVPQAIIAFLESQDYEDAIRNAISLGGDSDTIACITGGIAQAYYGGVPPAIANQTLSYLNEHLSGITEKFMLQYCA
ncbi:ADP-ribosylglycohydrolase family protein [Nostoc sp. FACHB-152]|uniref:ADP-ribosylglycohydrolase family protein n=1 Tax=unclassified Nostoc TaxID=2593658 RepID=UPI0016840D2F|nr:MULTISPECIES: ADP-ribosylglycohydrolase family protein [unclassified Nostoc]MBD2447181.1 ADP-ribosylglycohydrolase family protein [Nostoc sp. FACHB-152]MBD2469141.1 ADP-ribosylglycohydrolase family protein [Nostoc sp. FACHB-145]